MKPRTHPAGFACLVLAGWTAASGCARPVQMVFELDDPVSEQRSFWALGYPTDLRVDDEGRIDLAAFPRRERTVPKLLVEIVEAEVRGYGPVTPAYVRLTGLVDAAALPEGPADYESAVAPVQILDVDPDSPERGRRFPLEVRQTLIADFFRPAFLLQALPSLGITLREDTTYALIVTDGVVPADGFELQLNPALQSVLTGRIPPGALGPKAVQVFAPLADQLALDGIDPERIVAATVWTTGRPTAWLEDLVGRFAHGAAPAPDGPFVRTLDYPAYCVLESTWSVPGFQDGLKPYYEAGEGGVFRRDEDGTPIQQYTRTAPIVLTIPKRPMPPAGYPLMLYLHGTGAESADLHALGRQEAPELPPEPGGGPGRVAAGRGFGAAVMGQHLSVEDVDPLFTLNGTFVYNFFNPRAFVGNFAQLIVEEYLFRRLVEALALDPTLCPEADASAAPDGALRFDADTEVLVAHSLGALYGSILAVLDPRPFDGIVFLNPGATFLEFVFGYRDPIVLVDFVNAIAFGLPPWESVDLWHPALSVGTLALARADNVHFLRRLVREPDPGRPVPHTLVIEGYPDPLIGSNVQQPFVAGIGSDLVGPEAAPPGPNLLGPRIELAGGAHSPYPLVGNRAISGQGPITVGTVVHPADGHSVYDGHDVAYQLDAAKHQYGCFLEDIAAGKLPTIIEGSTEGGPCAP